MAGNMHIDDLRIAEIRDGLVYFKVESGRDDFRFCMSVGRYRVFIAGAANFLDEWIASRDRPLPIAAND